MTVPVSTTPSSWFLDLVFPRNCLSCDDLLPTRSLHRYLCDDCFATFPVKTSMLRLPGHALDMLISTTVYKRRLPERLVKMLKYRFVPDAANDMADLMVAPLRPWVEKLPKKSSLIMTAIPLHPRRLRWRGFNQADLLAKQLSDRLQIPYIPHVLIRTQFTKPQAEIEERSERIANAQRLFDLAVGPLSEKTILLVDDVATTGATLDDAAKTLKAAGAAFVIGIVFAR